MGWVQRNTARPYVEKGSKLEFTIGSLPSEIWNPAEEKKLRLEESEGIENIRRARSIDSNKQGLLGVIETKAPSIETAQGCTRSSVYMLLLLS